MEGSSTDRHYPEERVWVHVLPRYARILVPDETKHYRTAPKKKMVSCSTQTDTPTEAKTAPPAGGGEERPVHNKEKDKAKQKEEHILTEDDNTSVEEKSSPRKGDKEVEKEERSASTDCWKLKSRKHDPPTTSKAPPPTPYSSVISTETSEDTSMRESAEQGECQMKSTEPSDHSSDSRSPSEEVRGDYYRKAKRARCLSDPEAEEVQVKEEENTPPDAAEDEEQHRRLSGLLPYLLDSRTDGELRSNIETICEQQPAWMRSQIKSEICTRSRDQGYPVTPRQVNTAMWRNYRLKVTQVTALFGVQGMKRVINLCLAGEDREQIQLQATG